MTTPNQVYGVATSDDKQQQSVDKIELTQNQVYGESKAATEEFIKTNPVYETVL